MLLITARRTGRGRFLALVDGRILPLAGSHTPLFTAARHLIAHGLDPATELALQYEGASGIAFRMRADQAAALLATEPDRVTVVPPAGPQEAPDGDPRAPGREPPVRRRRASWTPAWRRHAREG